MAELKGILPHHCSRHCFFRAPWNPHRSYANTAESVTPSSFPQPLVIDALSLRADHDAAFLVTKAVELDHRGGFVPGSLPITHAATDEPVVAILIGVAQHRQVHRHATGVYRGGTG